jgi:hypothetical protein
LGINFTKYNQAVRNAEKAIGQANSEISNLIMMISGETTYSKEYQDKLEKLRAQLVDLRIETTEIANEFKNKFKGEC